MILQLLLQLLNHSCMLIARDVLLLLLSKSLQQPNHQVKTRGFVQHCHVKRSGSGALLDETFDSEPPISAAAAAVNQATNCVRGSVEKHHNWAISAENLFEPLLRNGMIMTAHTRTGC